MRKLILVLLFLTFSTLSFARGGGGGGRVGGGVRGGYVGTRSVSVGTGSRVVFGTGNGRVFIGGYPFRGGYGYRNRYGYGAYYGGWGLGFASWPEYYGYGYDVNNGAVPDNGNVPSYSNVPDYGNVAPNDPNTANVSHSRAVIITVGPDGYTRDGVFHSFH